MKITNMKITKKTKYLISAIVGGGIILAIAIVVPLTINKDKKVPSTFNLQEIKNQMRIAINSKTLPNTKVAIVKMYQNGTKLVLSSQAQTAAVVLAQYIYNNKATKVFTFQLGQDQKGNQLLLTISSSNKATNETNSSNKSTYQLKWVRDVLTKVEFGILFQIYQQRLSSQQTLDGTKIANREIKATDFQREKTPQEKLQAKLAQEAIQKLVAADFTIGINKNKIAELGQPNQDNVVADIRKKINNPKVKASIWPSDIIIKSNNVAKTVAIIINNYGPSKTITISGFVSIKDYLDKTYKLNQVLTNILSSGGALIIPKGITSSQFHAYIQVMGDVFGKDGKFVMNKFAEKYQSKITSVIFPNSFTTIGDWFAHFDKITSLTIPNSITSIGEKAFYKAQLTSLTIPNSVISIESRAFYKAELKSLTIPNSVTSIGRSAFLNSPLKSLILGNQLQIINRAAFYKAELKSLTIPDSVTSIGRSAFASSKLRTLIIPDLVISIGKYAFFESPLKSLILGENLQTIDEMAFREAELKSLTIPDSVTSIANRAFDYSRLKTLILGNQLQTIGEKAFSQAQLTSLIIPNSVISIESAAFSSSPLKTLTWGKQLKTIESAVFFDARLTSLVIPNWVTSIGFNAFYNSPLRSLILGEQLKTIDEGAFYNAKLETLTIPGLVTSIGNYAFYNSPIRTINIFRDVRYGSTAFDWRTKIIKISRL